MAQFNIPWDADPARTHRGVGPLGASAKPSSPRDERARYRLGSRMGHSGQVYEAENTRYAGRLVVKLFPFATGIAPTAVHGFTGEATRVADLRHPHITQVIASGTFADGTPFVAMERLFGQSLEERIAGRGALPVSEILPVVRGIASALSAAHAAGVVHRELRPDNVFICDLAGYDIGFAKVFDFGVSQLTAGARIAGRIVGPGTIRTLAPEQRQGRVDLGDERTDQYALAAITYRLLTGTEPLTAEEGGPGFERMSDGSVGLGAFLVRGAPAVDAVLRRALSRRPENRFDSVALFFRAIEDALAGTSSTSTSGPAREDAPTAIITDVPAASVLPHVIIRDAPTASVLPHAIIRDAPTASVLSHAPTLRATVPPAASLTQQFFIEGDRQEAGYRQSSLEPLEGTDETTDRRAAKFASFDRVPRRRAPLIAAALMATAGLGIAARVTNSWPFAAAAPAIGQGQRAAIPLSRPPVVAPPLPPTIVAPPPPTIVAAPPPTIVAPPPPTIVAAPPPTIVAAPLPTISAPGIVAGAPDSTKQTPTGSPDRGTGPLRGYVWSPTRGRLVHARPAPVPTESPPPPPMTSLTTSPVEPVTATTAPLDALSTTTPGAAITPTPATTEASTF